MIALFQFLFELLFDQHHLNHKIKQLLLHIDEEAFLAETADEIAEGIDAEAEAEEVQEVEE